jgi:hypothetical protein
VVLSDDDGAADTAALSHAEPVLTETMAELYLRQGHREDALRVYEALLAQRPRDQRLRARVQALSPGAKPAGRVGEGGGGGTEGTGESVQAFLKRILAGRPRAVAAVAVAESSLASAFAVAPLEPEPRPPVDAQGEATHPADDAITLDQVFGDESGAPDSPPPPPQPEAAPPASSPVPATPVAEGSGGFSFDQFFGGPVSGGSAAGSAPPAPRPSGRKPRGPAEDEGDLDQFQAWLKGLKS